MGGVITRKMRWWLPSDGGGFKARSLALPHKIKYRPLYLVLLGVVIIGLELYFFYRQLIPLTVDLGDWNPVLPELENNGLRSLPNSRGNSNSTENLSHRSPHRATTPPAPDGMFNGYPIYFQSVATNTTTTIVSQIHCIGETYADPYYWTRRKQKVDMNWVRRSCHFQFLCIDLDTHEFVLRLPRLDSVFPSNFESQQTVFTNQSVQGHPFGISIGGINTKWTHAGYPRLHWFPRIDYIDEKVDDNDASSSSSSSSSTLNFYALPANVTLMPFHSLSASNPGHLIWDDFLPLYTLLQIFHSQEEDATDPLLIRYQLPGEEGLWAGCDWKHSIRRDCEAMLKKFVPLMVRNPNAIPITTQHDMRLSLYNTNNNGVHGDSGGGKRKANLVCAKQGMAGIGALTDHGVDKGHGWEDRDYSTSYNQGRGGQLWRFRNFLLSNLNISTSTEPPRGPPYRVVFSERSSKISKRAISFTSFINALKKADGLDDIEILAVEMKDYTLKEQAEMVSHAAIYVTACGGGAVTATFLPRGASLLVFFDPLGGVESNKRTLKPARLDWDYFNNMAYAKVHWLTTPRTLAPSFKDDIQLFVELVRHEIEVIRVQRAAYDAGMHL